MGLRLAAKRSPLQNMMGVSSPEDDQQMSALMQKYLQLSNDPQATIAPPEQTPDMEASAIQKKLRSQLAPGVHQTVGEDGAPDSGTIARMLNQAGYQTDGHGNIGQDAYANKYVPQLEKLRDYVRAQPAALDLTPLADFANKFNYGNNTPVVARKPGNTASALTDKEIALDQALIQAQDEQNKNHSQLFKDLTSVPGNKVSVGVGEDRPQNFLMGQQYKMDGEARKIGASASDAVNKMHQTYAQLKLALQDGDVLAINQLIPKMAQAVDGVNRLNMPEITANTPSTLMSELQGLAAKVNSGQKYSAESIAPLMKNLDAGHDAMLRNYRGIISAKKKMFQDSTGASPTQQKILDDALTGIPDPDAPGYNGLSNAGDKAPPTTDPMAALRAHAKEMLKGK